jgi:hypothetical protein
MLKVGDTSPRLWSRQEMCGAGGDPRRVLTNH